MSRIVECCQQCGSDRLERCFGVSKELWGWSHHCLDCNWRGQGRLHVDRWAPVPRHEDEYEEPEPFLDYPE